MRSTVEPRRSPYLAAAAFLLAAAVITAAAYRFHHVEREVIEEQVRNQLLSVADLKVHQLARWRQERLGHAYSLMFNRMMMPALERVAAGSAGAEDRRQALNWMEALRKHLNYANVVLASPDGKVVMSAGPWMGSAKHFEEIARQVLAARGPVLRDFHAGDNDGRIHLGMNFPLQRDAHSPPFGILMLGIDPAEHLYQLIQSWPVPSRSAETLLVRREGTEVVYLNDLRHRKHTALQLRIPLARTEVPAVQGAMGKEGLAWGRDYRGTPVLAAIRHIPGTPWILIAKVDEDEVHAPIRRRSLAMGAGALVLILAAGAVILYLWRRQQLRFYQERYQAEIDRRAILGHYDYLSRFANDIIILADESGRIVEANDRAVATYGYTREQLLGMPGRNLCHPSTLDSFDQQWQDAIARGGAVIETLHQRKDGSPIPVEVSMRLIEVEGKRFYQAIIRDIRERIEMVEKLRETVATLNAVVEASPAAIVALTPDGRVTLWNRAAEKIFGYRAEEVLGCPLPDHGITSLEDRRRVQSALLAGEAIRPIECRLGRKDKTTVEVSLSAAPLRDADGKVAGMLGIMVDITERKRNEREQKLLSDTIAASLNEIYLFDAGTLRFRYVNQGALNNLGYTLAEMQSMTPLDIAPEFDSQRLEEVVQPLRTGEVKVQVFETTHRRADGSQYPVEVHLQLFDHEGERVFLAMILDITERRRAEEALRRSEEQLLQSQKLEGVGRLAGGVAHDFNNYLTVINGYCDMLLETLPSRSALHEQITRIRRAGEQAAVLTRQLLAFSRRQVLKPRLLNLNEVVADVQRMLQRMIGEDIELALMLDPALGAIMADPAQMGQVLMNLLVNARDAMPQGGKIVIETANVDLDETYAQRHPEVKPGPYVMLAVTDSGAGMDAETQQHIFEPFFTTKKSGEGTGLGLATVYGIVRQSGGWGGVYSEPGRGTTFKLHFPRIGSAAQALVEPDPVLEVRKGAETVLVVEDQAEVRMLTSLVLREAGYRVLEAASGEEALAYFQPGHPPIDLLFTDVVMTGMNGRDLAARVAKLSPSTRVLYTSGYTANVIAHRGVLDAGTEYRPQPCTPTRVLSKVREVLDRAPGADGAL